VDLTDSDLSELLAALKAGEMTDTIRTSLEWILQQLIEAEATEVIGARPHQRSAERTAQRNGHRPRLLSTPAGDVELKIPKLRTGSFFPSLLERRRRIDRLPPRPPLGIRRIRGDDQTTRSGYGRRAGANLP
jgi:putative transposase